MCRTGCVAAICGALLLAACGPTPPTRPDTGQQTAVTTAESLSRQGRHEAAADLYQQMAARAQPVARQRYLILTARERYLAGTPEVAQAMLDRLGTPIANSNRVLWSQVAAEIAIALGEPERALASLDGAPETADARDAAQLLRVRAEALFRLGRPVAATSAMLERGVWLDSAAAIESNQRLLWDDYRTWGVRSSAEDDRPGDDPVLTGWLALGEIAWNRRTTPASMRRALGAWQGEYPNHPANQRLIPELVAELPATQVFPQHVALLLPLSGKQQLAATAVRDGFLAAHFVAGDDEPRPDIRIYDVNTLGADIAYRQAVADGAAFVVGPLLKDAVQQIAVAGPQVPTLALNFLPDGSAAPADFYQFALSPEDEVRQIAERAANLGQLRALALAPNNAWGRRLLTAFTNTFQDRGGLILDYRFYDSGNPDFSSGIQQLLLIDESRARYDRLSANLGIPLDYEPRRRSDIDLIFLAATDQAGKLIRPQLRFHYAGSVPTYSTSAIYQEGTRNNADLNGIVFPDMPWIIAPDGQSEQVRDEIARYWPDQAQRRARLYALGFDAYRLIPTLNSGTRWFAADLPGMTGTLHIDEQGRILRRLAWARISRGKPELIAPAPIGPTPDAGPVGAWLDTSKPGDARSN